MRPMHILLAALLGMMGGLALGDELKPWPGPPAEQKPAQPPAAEPAKPADKPKEQPKPAPQKKPPAQEDESDPCMDGCDEMRREGLAACKDASSLPPPSDCRGNISNAAAECIKQCRGY